MLASGCSSLDTRRYYAPSTAAGETTWENPEPGMESLRRLGGPDNRIKLTEGGVTIELGSTDFQTPTVWLFGPAIGQTPIPIVPVFPIWWLFWLSTSSRRDKDLNITFVVESPVDLTYEPERWVIVTDKGDKYSPSSYSSSSGWEHPSGDASKPRSLKSGAHESLTYSTRGKWFKQFTLRPSFASQSGEIVFPTVILKRSNVTVLSIMK